jgi:hypothetical protein
VDFRVNDGFSQHPKTIGITLDATGAWLHIGVWCARYLTDGYIPDEVVAGIVGRRTRVIKELADRNLLTPAPGGWQMVDWAQYQRTRAHVEADREKNRARLAKWRAAKSEL